MRVQPIVRLGRRRESDDEKLLHVAIALLQWPSAVHHVRVALQVDDRAIDRPLVGHVLYGVGKVVDAPFSELPVLECPCAWVFGLGRTDEYVHAVRFVAQLLVRRCDVDVPLVE